MDDKSLLYSGGNKILFTTPLSELITKKVVTASRETTIREAAEMMSENRISSIILVDPGDSAPVGIVTDKDLRERVVARGRCGQAPVHDVMSSALITAEADDYAFEALLKMIQHNIHHLLVVERGELKGILTNHDLMMLQGIFPLSLAREIERHQSIEGLIPAAGKINRIVDLLIKEGTKARNIVRIITEINDRLLKKLLEITQTRLGPPPLDYCWIVLGSEGRKEQTFKTDQDNAIIYDDPKTPQDAQRAEAYFGDFARQMNEALIKCGFPPCPGNYMASNSLWRQPLKVWKEYFLRWINEPTPEAVLSSLIFYDFRPVSGNSTLAERLRAHLGQRIRNQNLFLAKMAEVITMKRPPLGFWGGIAVGKKGRHKNELNLKEAGLGLLAGAIRLFSLEKGVDSTSTLERLRDLKDKHILVGQYAEEFEQAFEFLMSLRIRHQLEQIEAGLEPDNYLNPASLSMLDKNTLKESFKLIALVQDFIVEEYKQGFSAR
ncbi:MAG: DUF294 nucleotidyltransferase-like domain-containing protein [Smithellaceae bacterium]|nr:DUF294 nucleotidyltransferase-like domain-containing protein [Smithellaceae bacterium]